VSVATLLAESTHEKGVPVRHPALASGDPTGSALLALDFGQKTGWAVRNNDGAIASSTAEFRVRRFDGEGMIFLRCPTWLKKVEEGARGAWATLALLHPALAQGARR
jgi:hypothetical protein